MGEDRWRPSWLIGGKMMERLSSFMGEIEHDLNWVWESERDRWWVCSGEGR